MGEVMAHCNLRHLLVKREKLIGVSGESSQRSEQIPFIKGCETILFLDFKER